MQAPAAAAGAAAPAGADQYCGSPADQGGISVNSVTSCPFAENVESAWESSGDASSVTAFSPATGLTYTMSCTASGTGYEVCTGGNNAYVEFPVTSAPAPSSGQFDDPCTQCADSTLSESVANEQQAALEAAPADDYYSADNLGQRRAHAAGRQHLLGHRDRRRRRHRLGRHDHGEPGREFLVRHGHELERSRRLVDGGPDYWATPAVSDYS